MSAYDVLQCWLLCYLENSFHYVQVFHWSVRTPETRLFLVWPKFVIGFVILWYNYDASHFNPGLLLLGNTDRIAGVMPFTSGFAICWFGLVFWKKIHKFYNFMEIYSLDASRHLGIYIYCWTLLPMECIVISGSSPQRKTRLNVPVTHVNKRELKPL